MFQFSHFGLHVGHHIFPGLCGIAIFLHPGHILHGPIHMLFDERLESGGWIAGGIRYPNFLGYLNDQSIVAGDTNRLK
jgi:hypothetical protein